MPEIPDLDVYIEHLERRLEGQPLEQLRIASAFVLRTVTPTPEAFAGRTLESVRRLAKQLVFRFTGDYFLVLHLMIAGRLQWREAKADSAVTAVPKRNGLLALDFAGGTVLVTEASKKKRASLKLLEGADALAALDPGGLEVQQATLKEFAERLKATPHTLKRALTDQRVFAGIGNAYSDEILHRAQLSPFKPVRNLSPAEIAMLYEAARSCLDEWTATLRAASGAKFPAKVTAFQPQMAVHGRYREPCPVCGAPVQRIRYAENEANYCARCQTGGKVLADRSLSRLLKDNWPKRIEDLEG